MSEMVHVPYGDNRAETAALLLAAAEQTDGVEQSVVTVDHFTDSFLVPEAVAKKAGLDTFDPDAEFNKAVEDARKAAESQAGQDGSLLSVDATEGETFADPGPTSADVAEAEAPKPAKKTAAKRTAKKSAK